MVTPLDGCQVEVLLGRVVELIFTYRKFLNWYSQWLQHFAVPPTVSEVSLFPKSPPAFVGCFVDLGFSDWGKIKPQKNLICISLIAKDLEQFLRYFFIIVVSSSWKLSIPIHSPFFKSNHLFSWYFGFWVLRTFCWCILYQMILSGLPLYLVACFFAIQAF